MKRATLKQRIVANPDRDRLVAWRVLEELKSTAPGIVFVGEKDHGARLAKAVEELIGLEVPFVSADLPKKQRQELADRIRLLDPDLPVVVSTSVWSQGIDIPSLGWGMWAGSGQAPIGLLQSVGRPLRPYESKHFRFITVDDVNLDARYEEQARKRQQHLAEAGFKGADPDFLEELGTNPPPRKRPEPQPLPTLWDMARTIGGPPERGTRWFSGWAVSVLIYLALTIYFTCTGKISL